MISHKFKAIFIHQRKCAGTSIFESFGLKATDTDFHALNDGVLSEPIGFWNVAKRNYPDYTVFSVVRNPWDRFVSGWKYCKSTRNRGIVDLLNDMPSSGHDYRHLTRPQSAILFNSDGSPAFDKILRFESLQRDYDELCRELGKPVTRLPHLNRTAHLDYRIYFTPTSRALFNELYRDDIDKFGYSF